MFLVFGVSRCRGEVHEVGRHAVCLAGSYPLRSYVADRGVLCFELLRLNYSSTTLTSSLDELVIRIKLVILTFHHRQLSRKPAVRYPSSYTASNSTQIPIQLIPTHIIADNNATYKIQCTEHTRCDNHAPLHMRRC